MKSLLLSLLDLAIHKVEALLKWVVMSLWAVIKGIASKVAAGAVAVVKTPAAVVAAAKAPADAAPAAPPAPPAA